MQSVTYSAPHSTEMKNETVDGGAECSRGFVDRSPTYDDRFLTHDGAISTMLSAKVNDAQSSIAGALRAR